MIRSILICFLIAPIVAACSKEEKSTSTDIPVARADWVMPDTASFSQLGKTKLSDYKFFVGTLKDLKPNRQVFPYIINSPLFSDYAKKRRFIYLPEGEKINYVKDDILDFPTGTILIKNFYYNAEQINGDDRILETRLLIRNDDSWIALPYLWNEEQTEAFLEISGRQIPVELADGTDLTYSVPDMLQCKGCHDRKGEITPIGPKAAQLNLKSNGDKNQLATLISMGWLINAPPKEEWPKRAAWDDNNAPLDERARAYLDINCGHCHRNDGPAKNSGLDLTMEAHRSMALGVFKSPVAAGRGSGGMRYDIIPGDPDKSILVFRMQSDDPGIRMPEVGRSVVHKEGVQLIREWVLKLPKEDS